MSSDNTKPVNNRISVVIMVLVGIALTTLTTACATVKATDIMEKPFLPEEQPTLSKDWLNVQYPDEVLYAPTLIGADFQVAVIKHNQGMELKIYNGILKEQTSIPLIGEQLEQMMFYDVDGDGIQEAFLGVVDKTLTQLNLLVYNVKTPNASLFMLPIKAFVLSSITDTMVLYAVIEEGPIDYMESYLQAYSLPDFEEGDKVALGFTNYIELFDGHMIDGQKAIFYSAGVGAHSAISDAVIKDDQGLLKTLFYGTDKEPQQPFTAYYASCKDIKEDGNFAFPFMDAAAYNKDSSMVGTIWLTRYAYYNQGQFEDVAVYHDTYYSTLLLDREWAQNWEIRRQPQGDNTIQFSYYAHQGSQATSSQHVMTLYYVDELQELELKKQYEPDQLELLSGNGNFSAYVVWGQGATPLIQGKVRSGLQINADAELYR